MRAGLIACGLVALVLSAPAASAQASYGQTRALNLFNQLVDNGQCEAALPEARTFWPSSVFQQLGPEDQSNFLAAVVQCAWFLQDGHAAIAAANAAHERGADWADKIRLVLGFSFDDDALSVQAFFDENGGDWPVVLMASEYRRWVDALDALTADLPEAARRKLWAENGRRFYRI